jgi:hypothetical protein
LARVISRYLAPVYILLCLLLGGASSAGFLANGALQLAGLICLLIVVLGGFLPELPKPARNLLALIGLAAALLTFELIPLPPFLWSLLPGRGNIAEGYALLGMSRPWLPISLSTSGTLAALCALIPVVTVVVLTYVSSGYGRLFSVYLIIATAVASVVLGLLQKMQGPDSLYYIYDVTNRGGVVGFFANRNHLATLLLATIPLIGALGVSPHRDKKQDDSKVGRLMVTGCMALLIAVGVIVVRSSAGWLLLPPTIFATVAIFLRGEKGKVPASVLQVGAVVAAICVVASIVAPIKMNDLGDKLSGIDPHMRNQSIRTTASAAVDYLPFGSGGGSFVHVYPLYENVESASLEYLNHAHNDYVEVFLEHGLLGLALIALALAFWLSRTLQLWRVGQGDAMSRAGSIVVAIVVAHSLVDYPLRTAAVAAIAAFSFALMVAPESAEMPSWQSARRRKRRGKSARSIEIPLAD